MTATTPHLPIGTLVRLRSDLGHDGRICIIIGTTSGPGEPLYKLGEVVGRRGPLHRWPKVRRLDHHVSSRIIEVLQAPTGAAP
ncbi:MAG: hypothetical protein L0G46_12050 [Kocuria sp.]|nr:hypothetical protein [Kocuria sp.]